MFYSRTKRKTTQPLNVGRKTKPTYSIKTDMFGHKEVYQSGETNFYEKIQGSLEETKIENIIKRAQMGDPYALNAKTTQFIDMTNAPTSLIEMHQRTHEASEQFKSLPLEVRAAYNHSAEQFIADYGSERMRNIFEGLKPKIKPFDIDIEGVTKNE